MHNVNAFEIKIDLPILSHISEKNGYECICKIIKSVVEYERGSGILSYMDTQWFKRGQNLVQFRL